MLYKKLTTEEIEFMECWYSPLALTECLFPLNYKAPQVWLEKDCELIRLRPYQHAMLDYSICYADDDKLTEKQNFQNKIGAGYLINVAARNVGKSFFAFMDAVITLLHGESDESCVASFDFAHLKKICSPISTFVNHHPIFDLYRRKGKECVRYIGGGLEIDTLLGHVMYGRNENVGSPDPGTAFHSLHVKKLIYDESSYMSDAGRKKMIDATSSTGCIERISGIPEVKLGNPIAKLLRDESKRNWICNMPQYVRCISKGSKILMADFSTKNIEDVKVGDKVFSISKNSPYYLEETTVLNKVCNGNRPTITINNDFNSLSLTSDHKLFTLMSKFYKTWKSYDELDLENHKIYYFKNYIQDMLSYYEGCFLGLLETEGSFKRNKEEKSIGQKDENKLLEFLLLSLNIKYTKYVDKKLSGFFYYYLLRENNDYINKLYIKLEKSKDVQLGFIAGCIYGDGSVCVKNKKIHNTKDGEIIIVQKNKSDLIERILKLANITYSKRVRQAKTNRGYFDGFTFSFKKFEVPLCVPYGKKSLKYQELCNYSSLMAIQSTQIKKVDENISEVYDLTTDTHSFIANGFIVHNCDWDEKTKAEKIEEYDGESSPMYKLNVLGEAIEGANSMFDMARIKENSYTTKKRIKQFEIGKETFSKFDKILVVDKQSAEMSIIASDIGTTGSPSEICIFFGNTELLKWRYNISLFMLTTQEQAQIFKWLYDKVENGIISLDCTNADGRSIADELVILGVPPEKIIRNIMHAKIIVGFETNDNGIVKCDDRGNPVYKLERTIDWAVLQLEKILYHGLCEVPHSEKFLREFANYFSVTTGTTKRYGTSATDHLLQSFQCMSIARFQTEFANLSKPNTQNTFVAGF